MSYTDIHLFKKTPKTVTEELSEFVKKHYEDILENCYNAEVMKAYIYAIKPKKFTYAQIFKEWIDQRSEILGIDNMR